MLRHCSSVIALAVMLVGLPTAHAADTTLTLACQGTVIETMMEEEKKPEPISMGIIVNFTNRTVQGFGHPGVIDYPVQITAWNEVTVAFRGSGVFGDQNISIAGTIDRVTGDLEATNVFRGPKTQTEGRTQYKLKCKPTQRMF